jgi:hypothetical protein
VEETDWFPLTACPVRPGVYKTIHIAPNRERKEGYSNWILGKGWGFTELVPKVAAMHKYTSGQQSKQWKGLTEETK